jgi:hypothetical protein
MEMRAFYRKKIRRMTDFLYISYMSELLKRLGVEKEKAFSKDFDSMYDLYKQKALDLGRKGDLRFIKEHGKIIVYVVIDDEFGRPDSESESDVDPLCID